VAVHTGEVSGGGPVSVKREAPRNDQLEGREGKSKVQRAFLKKREKMKGKKCGVRQPRELP